MRILFSMTNLDLGGAQMFVMRLAEELSDQGHEVYVYNHMPEWSNKDFISSFSGRVKILSFLDSHSAFFTWKVSAFISKFHNTFVYRHWLNQRYYRRTLKKYKFDIINSQMFDADRINAKVAVSLGIPFVITNHGEYELNFSNKTANFNNEAKFCLASAQAVIYTAQKNIDAIQPLLSKEKPLYKIIIGFNGNSVAKYPVNPSLLGIEKSDFVIGMVARGIPEKGWNEAIEMFKILKRKIQDRNIHLILIGNGNDLKVNYERNKEPNIHLLQFTSNTLEYFSWIEYFDAGMLLSYFKGESVPNAIIEYLYFNVPVVTTSMGDIKEMISSPQGMAGEIIPFANGKADPVFAAETLQRWIEDPAVYASVKKNTSGAFEKFNMKKIASQYLNVFKEVIDQYRK